MAWNEVKSSTTECRRCALSATLHILHRECRMHSILLWFLIYPVVGLQVGSSLAWIIFSSSPKQLLLYLQGLYQVLLSSSLLWLVRLGYISTLILLTFWARYFVVVGVSPMHYNSLAASLVSTF